MNRQSGSGNAEMTTSGRRRRTLLRRRPPRRRPHRRRPLRRRPLRRRRTTTNRAFLIRGSCPWPSTTSCRTSLRGPGVSVCSPTHILLGRLCTGCGSCVSVRACFFFLFRVFCALFRVQCWSYSGYQWFLERIAAAAVFVCVKRRQRGFFSACPACWRRELFHRAALGMHQVRRAPFRFCSFFLPAFLLPLLYACIREREGSARPCLIPYSRFGLFWLFGPCLPFFSRWRL